MNFSTVLYCIFLPTPDTGNGACYSVDSAGGVHRSACPKPAPRHYQDTLLLPLPSTQPSPPPLPTHTFTMGASWVGCVAYVQGAPFRARRQRLKREVRNPLCHAPSECSICLENILREGEVCSSCQQTMHHFCLRKWKYSCKQHGHKFTCPLCRAPLG